MLTFRSGRRGRTLVTVLTYLFAAGAVAGCSGDGNGDAGPASTSATTITSSTSTGPGSTEPGTAPTPRPSARQAVQELLEAERRGDHATSYRLLTSASRKEVGDVGDWAELRSDVPPIERFTIDTSQSAARVEAIVEHEPGLDPFIGLSAARERQTWIAAKEAGGWLVAGVPEVEYLLPADSDAPPAVRAWATAVQACDEAKAGELQAVEELFGQSEASTELCGSEGAVTVGSVGPVAAGPDSADLVAQYSTDVLQWARVVEVTGPTSPFSVVVAPIGDSWLVLGLAE